MSRWEWRLTGKIKLVEDENGIHVYVQVSRAVEDEIGKLDTHVLTWMPANGDDLRDLNVDINKFSFETPPKYPPAFNHGLRDWVVKQND